MSAAESTKKFLAGHTRYKRRRISTMSTANEAAADDVETERETDDIGPLFLNRWVDCQDTHHKWYEAQITAIDKERPNRYKVHYKGWIAKFDEWIDMDRDSDRIRVLHTFTPRGSKFGEVELRQGIKCDVLDSTDKWYQAQVIEHDKIHNYVKFHYSTWSSAYDEWINADSYRIAPLHTKTSKKTTTTTTTNKSSTRNTKSTTSRPGGERSNTTTTNTTNTTNATNANLVNTLNSSVANTASGANSRGLTGATGRNTSTMKSVPVATANVEDENDQKHGINTNSNNSNSDEKKAAAKKAWDALPEADKQKKRKNFQIRLQYMLNFKPTKQQEVCSFILIIY